MKSSGKKVKLTAKYLINWPFELNSSYGKKSRMTKTLNKQKKKFKNYFITNKFYAKVPYVLKES